MKYSVTGRVWNAETRQHDKVQTIEFERLIDAKGFMALNRDWIAGMVMDRDAEARAHDAAVAAEIAAIPEAPASASQSYAGLVVTVDGSTQFATVYDRDGKPAGTLQRKRAYERGWQWRVFKLDGTEVGRSTFVGSCLRHLAKVLA